ncbi:MAG: FAD-binding oxidoreductase [Herpetosiphon sp.]
MQLETLRTHLEETVGSDNVRAALPADAVGTRVPEVVVAPGTYAEVAQVLRYAHDRGLRVLPRGGGSKQQWGNRPRAADIVLSTERLNTVLEHASGDMTLTVQSGCTLATINRTLGEHGQFLALDSLWPERATIGGIIATNDNGSLRARYGAVRDLIIGIAIVIADGTLARSGGKVVKNVAGYDLPKLMTGAFGTLGVIVEANFRLHPLPMATQTLVLRSFDLFALTSLMLKIADATLVPSGVQLQVGTDGLYRLAIRFEGLPVSIEAQTNQLTNMVDTHSVTMEAAPDDEIFLRGTTDLWSRGGAGIVCKVSTLPSEIMALTGSIVRVAKPLRLDWEMVMQAAGVGFLRIDGPNEQTLMTAINLLRSDLQCVGGALVVVQASEAIKERLDTWGAVGNSIDLMRRIKERFDPTGLLNPGRFVGGI